MVIESVMYFALGALVSALLALMIIPAVWKRAVRLTKKRIEAATPITMAEFRADKDQLRAEFALSTRRLEMNVEALRRRLADQLHDINRNKNSVGLIKGEREQHVTIVRELEEREAELRRRILELEKEGADLAQRLRMRDREYADKVAQLDHAREAMRSDQPRSFTLDGTALSGNYDQDVEALLNILAGERKRLAFLETQEQSLLAHLEHTNRRTDDATAAAAELREALARKEDSGLEATNQLVAAEARIADAENRVSAILVETKRIVEDGEAQRDMLLAEKLSLEEEIKRLRQKVEMVEAQIMADWDTDRIEQAHLRERLNDIASDVSRLVYAVEGEVPVDEEESLYERVQRFADDGIGVEEIEVPPVNGHGQPANGIEVNGPSAKGSVAERMTALEEIIQSRN